MHKAKQQKHIKGMKEELYNIICNESVSIVLFFSFTESNATKTFDDITYVYECIYGEWSYIMNQLSHVIHIA